jgi:hypothetical protein
MIKAVECMGEVESGGRIKVPLPTMIELGLKAMMPVRVILIPVEESEENKRRREAYARASWRRLDELRDKLSGKPGSLTDALLQAREEEDDATCGRYNEDSQ